MCIGVLCPCYRAFEWNWPFSIKKFECILIWINCYFGFGQKKCPSRVFRTLVGMARKHCSCGMHRQKISSLPPPHLVCLNDVIEWKYIRNECLLCYNPVVVGKKQSTADSHTHTCTSAQTETHTHSHAHVWHKNKMKIATVKHKAEDDNNWSGLWTSEIGNGKQFYIQTCSRGFSLLLRWFCCCWWWWWWRWRQRWWCCCYFLTFWLFPLSRAASPLLFPPI